MGENVINCKYTTGIARYARKSFCGKKMLCFSCKPAPSEVCTGKNSHHPVGYYFFIYITKYDVI